MSGTTNRTLELKINLSTTWRWDESDFENKEAFEKFKRGLLTEAGRKNVIEDFSLDIAQEIRDDFNDKYVNSTIEVKEDV